MMNESSPLRDKPEVLMNTLSSVTRKPDLQQQWAILLVLLLFPLFYLYNSGLALGIFSPFAGTWFGLLSALVGLPFLAFVAIKWTGSRSHHLAITDALLVVMVVYFAIWSVVFHYLGTQWYNHADGQIWVNFVVIMEWLVLYVTFKHYQYDNKTVNKILFVLSLIMAIVAIKNSSNGFFYAARLESADVSATISTYQGFSRSALIVCGLLLGRLRGWRFVSYAVFSVVLIFLLGARTEFVGLLLFILICTVFGNENKIVKAAVFFVFAASIVFLLAEYSGIANQSRIANLLNVSHDESWQVRQEFGRFAWRTIVDNPVLGDFGSQYMISGHQGSYSHNALSAWVTYGLLGFLLFISMNLLCFLLMVRQVIINRFRCNSVEIFAFGMSLYCIVIMIFAANVNSEIYAVGWGATAACLMRRVDKGVTS